MSEPTFLEELTALINKHSRENGSNTPDFLLAEYLVKCLEVFETTTMKRENWYGRYLPVEEGERR